ncbi:MAG: transcription elongation factor GreA [Bacilli bacterium]|nr:transcription elongation factor GreA [Bacilli bacterium]
MAEKIVLTKSGLEKVEAEYRELIDVIRPQVVEDLSAARAQGDLSENADYDAARKKQAEVEARIKELEYIKEHAEIISEDVSKSKKIRLGSTVEFKDLSDNEVYTYKIVGSVEADPINGKISNECELGKSLIDHKVGDLVVVKTDEPYEVEIIKVKID